MSAPSSQRASLTDEKAVESTSPASVASDSAVPVTYTPDEEKRLVRKLDFLLVPICSLLYLLSFLDRSNIGNAKLEGLVTDLEVKDYATVLSIFFVGYIIAEIPANIVLKLTSPTFWLPTLTLAWGILTVVQGLVHNEAGLYATRFFLGVAEAGLFPGIVYLFSAYYRRAERVFRVSLFFAAAAASGAFGGALAYCIGLMRGIAGKAGWSWIFIIEGLATVVISFAAYFLVPNFPEKCKSLTERERALIFTRLAEEDDDEAEEGAKGFRWADVTLAFKDPACYLYSLLFHGFAFALYSSSLYLPTIIQGLGYKSWQAQLLTVPPYALAFVYTMAIAVASQRYKRRAPFILSSAALSILGYIVLITSPTTGGSYTAVFITLAGIYSGNALLLAWPSENIRNRTHRAVALAMVISLGDIGAIVGTQLYRKPLGGLTNTNFRVSHGLAIVYVSIGAAAAASLWILLSRRNAELDRIQAKEGAKGPADDRRKPWRYQT